MLKRARTWERRIGGLFVTSILHNVPDRHIQSAAHLLLFKASLRNTCRIVGFSSFNVCAGWIHGGCCKYYCSLLEIPCFLLNIFISFLLCSRNCCSRLKPELYFTSGSICTCANYLHFLHNKWTTAAYIMRDWADTLSLPHYIVTADWALMSRNAPKHLLRLFTLLISS